MGKIIQRILLIGIIAAIAIAVFSLRPTNKNNELKLYGNVDIREVTLSFRTSGRLTEMHVEEGDSIKRGDILATLDAEPFHNELAVAEARLARTTAILEKLKSGSRPQEIKSAEARVRESQASYKEAKRDLARQRELVAVNAVSRKVLDQAQAKHDETKAKLATAMESLALVKEGSRTEDIDAGQAEYAEAIAQRNLAQIRLEDTILKAPQEGSIMTRNREPGSMVAVGQAVYTLSLINPVYVRAYAPETILSRIIPGTEVLIKTDSSTTDYKGQIGFISPRAEFTPKTVETPELRTNLVYRLRIVVYDPDNGLRQGMPVTIYFPGIDMME